MTLAASEISVRFAGRAVVDRLSATFTPGQVTAIVGPNGAGKSTFLACLAGLRAPDCGVVSLNGAALFSLTARERARRIAFLEQAPQVAWPVDVRTLVGLGRTPYLGATGLGDEDRAAVETAMAQANVIALAERLVPSLSGGERARVLIARALTGAPDWLIADEPLAGLDPGHQLDAARLFRRLAAEGRGVVVTIHDLTLAARTADRILVMHEGAALSDGAPTAALTPEVLAQAYGVEAVLAESAGGALIEIIRRLV